MAEPTSPTAVEQIVAFMTKIMRPLNFILGLATVANAVFIILFGPEIGFRVILNVIFTGFLGALLLAGEFK